MIGTIGQCRSAVYVAGSAQHVTKVRISERSVIRVVFFAPFSADPNEFHINGTLSWIRQSATYYRAG